MNVWCVRADFGKYADAFRNEDCIAIDYSISEPFPAGQGRDAFTDTYKKYYPQVSSNVVIGQQVGQFFRFCEEIKPGDYVITPSEDTDTLYYGKVLDDPYRFEPEPGGACPHRHRRGVRWSAKTLSRSERSVPFQHTLRSSLTVFGISQKAEFLMAIGCKTQPCPENPHDMVLEQILKLDAQEFEILAGHLLAAVGFEEIKVIGKPGDGGVDATGVLNVFNIAKIRVYVQAKRYKKESRIKASDVKKLRSSIETGGQGAFVTTAKFQKKAHEIAAEPGFPRIGLVDGRQLVDLLVEHWKDIPSDFQEKLGLKVGLVLSG